jgi:hypothetical protein
VSTSTEQMVAQVLLSVQRSELVRSLQTFVGQRIQLEVDVERQSTRVEIAGGRQLALEVALALSHGERQWQLHPRDWSTKFTVRSS